MKRSLVLLIAAAATFLLAAGQGHAHELAGQIIDAKTGAPISEAIVTADGRANAVGTDGRFDIDINSPSFGVRAPGYQRKAVAISSLANPAVIGLDPFQPKALYLSFYGVGNSTLRNAALDMIRETEVNAVVIDVKGDRGLVSYRTAVPLAAEIGAQRTITIADLPALLADLHRRGVYVIARIVAFRDDPLASARPDLAVRRQDGSIFADRQGLRWVDPTKRDVWDYNIALAADAAAAGFDEIQFDYLRFPDDKDIRFSAPNNADMRTATIRDFLDTARQRLAPYNVFLAVDVFGYICWNLNDTGIGQRLQDILPRVDYLSPMLYPSGFQFGIPGYSDPMAHIREIVKLSLDRIRQRAHVSPQRIRPWLQAFKDYAFDRRIFGADEIRQQIGAADAFGSDGWMLWNPRNVYSDEGLERETACR
jgi:hypothetical protein